MTDSRTYRDWQPGDGIRCVQTGKAPAEMPCGRPVRTLISIESAGPGRGKRTRISALCANHSDWSPGPSRLMLQARQCAAEKLIAAHWDEYRQYLKEFVEAAIAEIRPDGEKS